MEEESPRDDRQPRERVTTAITKVSGVICLLSEKDSSTSRLYIFLVFTNELTNMNPDDLLY